MQGDQLRASAKKRDDLHTVIALLKNADLDTARSAPTSGSFLDKLIMSGVAGPRKPGLICGNSACR